ncbi:nuclear transport factor 2 family protein [Rhodothermus marinus]|uniref:nuclear transport factor 2 family protein n=1 Tax=Rhodothermus marinus TaxID=29549 RepID=UPI0012BA40A3|nr:nuclear transport factor 2 family protein [Rhodothermus marinus]BBM70375.1 hypothetical protein RmaAA213_22210 [Rhodothermus marinus]BBM73362.1 hypothetical protein RmaAA338_22270 [Rhodothermus marinus]
MIGAWLVQRKTPAIYQAFNRHDLKAVLSNFADDVTFVFPGDVRASGVHSGKEAVTRWFEQFFAQFPTLRFTVHRVAVANLFDMVGNNVVVTHWDVEVVNRQGRRGQNSGVTVTTLRRGKAVHIQDLISFSTQGRTSGPPGGKEGKYAGYYDESRYSMQRRGHLSGHPLPLSGERRPAQ